MSQPRSSITLDPQVDFANTLAMIIPRESLEMIDLHGQSVENAKNIVTSVITNASGATWDRLRIVTGRGNHVNSKGERGSIKKSFKEWFEAARTDNMKLEEFDGYYEVVIYKKIPLRDPLYAFMRENISNILTSSIDELKIKASQKDICSLIELSIRFDRGHGVGKDYKKSTACLLEIKACGDVYVEYELGCRYYLGKGIRQNDAEAIKYFTLSADKGYIPSACVLADIYRLGITGKANPVLAHKYYLIAAEAGYPESARRVGESFNEGSGCNGQNLDLAIHWLKIAVAGKDAPAAFSLYFIYQKTDPKLAFHYLALSAELGEPDGQLFYGLHLFYGMNGTTKDMKQGIKWFIEAGKQGQADALFILCKLTMKNQPDLAIKYLVSAAEARSVDAQCNILFYTESLKKAVLAADSKKDKTVVLFTKELQAKIKKLFLQQHNETILKIYDIEIKEVIIEMMQDEGDADYVNKAQSLLKIMAKSKSNWAMYTYSMNNLHGVGSVIKINSKLAYTQLQQGEKSGDGDCLALLGRYWVHGLGLHLPVKERVNVENGLSYYARATQKNNPLAHSDLGNYYSSTSFPKSIEHYEKAMQHSMPNKPSISAQIGLYANSAAQLGLIYEVGGRGIRADICKALAYFKLAASHGSLDAKKILNSPERLRRMKVNPEAITMIRSWENLQTWERLQAHADTVPADPAKVKSEAEFIKNLTELAATGDGFALDTLAMLKKDIELKHLFSETKTVPAETKKADPKKNPPATNKPTPSSTKPASQLVTVLKPQPTLIVVNTAAVTLEVKGDVVYDKSYSLGGKPRVADTPTVKKLKKQTSLAFFAVKSGEDKIDAVVQCNEESEFTQIQQLQTTLSCTGKFFKSSSKNRYFVLEGLTLPMANQKPSVSTQVFAK
jgi:TPR repeat protein